MEAVLVLLSFLIVGYLLDKMFIKFQEKLGSMLLALILWFLAVMGMLLVVIAILMVLQPLIRPSN